jgi:Condensation domain
MHGSVWNSGESVRIPFDTGYTRTGPLTVGQANMRRCVLRDEPAHMNACVIRKLPDACGLDRIAEAVHTLVLRHESLRTTYPEQPDLRQELAATGSFTLFVHAAQGDPLAHARTLGDQMRAVRFAPETELPIRLAVVTVDGVPDRIVFVLCHIAVDAGALDLINHEWDALMAGQPLPEPGARQPVSVALDEQSEAGRRRLAASLRYWESVLRTTPQSMFAIPGVDRTDWMHPRLRIRSVAAAGALPAITERTGASGSNLVLAALCALLGRRLDQSTIVMATPAANRVASAFAEYVGTVAQDALFSVSLAGAEGFDEVVTRTRSRAFTALRHSRFDYEDLAPVIARVEHERGSHWARDCVFNDLTGLELEGLLAPTPVPAAAATGAVNSAAVADDPQLDWFQPESMMTRLMVWVVRLDGELELALWADPKCLPPDDAEELAGDLVRLLVAAADGDVRLDRLAELGRLRRVERGEGWYEIDSCLIELAAVRALLAEVLAGRPHLVEAVADPQLGHRLECWLAADGSNDDAGVEADVAAVHAACLEGLRHRRLAAMAPHRYLVVDRVPDDPGSAASWRARRLFAQSTGRVLPAVAVAVGR